MSPFTTRIGKTSKVLLFFRFNFNFLISKNCAFRKQICLNQLSPFATEPAKQYNAFFSVHLKSKPSTSFYPPPQDGGISGNWGLKAEMILFPFPLTSYNVTVPKHCHLVNPTWVGHKLQKGQTNVVSNLCYFSCKPDKTLRQCMGELF